MQNPIGFIGQGWIGKNYADDFETRGYTTVRYGLEEPYAANKEKIKDCQIVFIAVPTPTTPEGFDDSIVREAVGLVGAGHTAVIKSTMVPGTTESIQAQYPDVFVMHSPEFLSRNTAKEDTEHPAQNIMGISKDTPEHRERAEAVLSILPDAPASIVSARTAELFKYVHNTSIFAKSLFMNLLYDLAERNGVAWDDIKTLITRAPMLAVRDPFLPHWHIDPNPQSGRGIGGDCHIKDFEALCRMYTEEVHDEIGMAVLEAMKRKNISLLLQSKKDLDLLRGVYGEDIVS